MNHEVGARAMRRGGVRPRMRRDRNHRGTRVGRQRHDGPAADPPAPIPVSFYARPAEAVARDLLGCTVVHGGLRGRVVETEAYVGPHDLACHARAGRTPRTEVLFGPADRAYVYLIYGMHHMLNVVTGPVDHGEAVLVRAVEPAWRDVRTDGPGRLTRAMGIDRRLDGHDLGRAPLWLEAGPAPARIDRGPRIGVDYAGDWAAAPLRFWDAESPWVTGGAGRRLPDPPLPAPKAH